MTISMTKIELNVDMKKMHSLYHDNGGLRILFNPNSKNQSWMLIIACAGLPFFLSNFMYYSGPVRFCGFIFFGLCFYNFWKVTAPILKKRKEVKQFIERVKDTKELTFSYNNQEFIHSQNGDLTNLKWSEINDVFIANEFISINSPQNFLLPKNMMTEEEFQALSLTITTYVNGVRFE